MSEPPKRKPGSGSVRIIGGRWRRRRITVPAGVDLRPSPDRVRETLFNWLGPRLPGAECLDLFAGTGVLAFEALSRGAGSAVLVERDARAAAALASLRDELGADARVVAGEAAAFLEHPTGGPFDLAFVDPPYALGVDAVLAALPAVLKPGAFVYLERARSAAWPALPGYLWTRRSEAGAVAFGLACFDPAAGV
jgi:16S rRNA (guanine966-N2)-methyltransferase